MNTIQRSGTVSERSRWPALAAKMSSPDVTHNENKRFTMKQKIDRWYVLWALIMLEVFKS